MGTVRFGAPEKEILLIARAMGLSTFFEGGTYMGGTALLASGNFEKVITVECSEIMFEIAGAAIGDVKNIVMLKGDTRSHLHEVLDANDNILFWLDAHWSGGDTYGENDECPLVDELKMIFESKKNYAILVDDARLFLAPPPKPHKLERWPTIKAVVEVLPDGWELIVHEDVIYLLPGQISMAFRQHVQDDITKKWQKSAKGRSLMSKALSAVGIKRC